MCFRSLFLARGPGSFTRYHRVSNNGGRLPAPLWFQDCARLGIFLPQDPCRARAEFGRPRRKASNPKKTLHPDQALGTIGKRVGLIKPLAADRVFLGFRAARALHNTCHASYVGHGENLACAWARKSTFLKVRKSASKAKPR